jgi:capsular polysaccharide biosynthesis protein
MILVLLLALAAGFGFPQVAESMDGSINSARAIERVQGSPPLAEIPLITNSSDKMQQRKLKLGVLVGIPIAIAIIAALVHFFVINLDVLWYVLVRRMGM